AETAGKADADVAIKYASSLAGWNNGSKNMAGMLDGFRRADAAGTKHREEAGLVAWLEQRGGEGRAALANYREYAALIESQRATRERNRVVNALAGSGLLGSANRIYRLAQERALDDAAREPGYQQRDWPGIEAGLRQLERRMDVGVDRQILEYWL